MLRVGYWLAVATGFVVYLIGFRADSTLGFLAEVAHWPARLLRAVGVGRWLDVPSMALADWAVASMGAHRWLLIVLILLVLLAVSWWAIRADKPPLWIFTEVALTALSVPFWSALISGCYLARAANVLDGPADVTRRTALWGDLVFGMKPMSPDAPARTIRRLARFSKRRLLPIEQLTNPKLVTATQRALKFWSDVQAKIAFAPPRPSGGANMEQPDKEMELLASVAELSWRLLVGYSSATALHGRGGDPDQHWREITILGLAGARIVLRTNILPPDPVRSMIVPGNSGLEAARRRFSESINSIPDATTRQLMSQFNSKPLNKKELNDTLFQLAYALIAGLPAMQNELEKTFGLTATFNDADGPLVVEVHNSVASYARSIGPRVDRGGLGIYVRNENTINVVQDEAELTRNEAWQVLNGLSNSVDDHPSSATDSGSSANKTSRRGYEQASEDEILSTPALQRMFRGSHVMEGMQIAYPHEVAHWMFASAASALPGGAAGLPACIHEGVALFVEQRITTDYRKMLLTIGAPQPAAELRDWHQTWVSSNRDVGQDQRALLLLSDAAFGAEVERDALSLYADCWLIVRRTGHKIFDAMKTAKVPLPVVLERNMIPTLAVPWRDVRGLEKARERDLRRLEDLRREKRVFHMMGELNGHPVPPVIERMLKEAEQRVQAYGPQ